MSNENDRQRNDDLSFDGS